LLRLLRTKRKRTELWVHRDNDYRNFKDKESVEVGKQALYGKGYFLIIMRKIGGIQKAFKTKTAALKFAKSYMSKH